ncbi:phage integrase N-terminal SAM-like domain-containing protein [Novosphingobium aquimarinum]|uniref:phage integrase N-terminal SAM-like domain-containing protein n=1 Tax=Novosphingobium aquimarinum TaxID=2682494 RepID=UPI001E43D3DE|nr:phage integrase N-terminal SAM-like domain-containing protein [Novosphingobium aquimarinum]
MDTITTAAPSHSLRERMLQDMTMRGLGAHTQKDYIRHARSFAAFLGRPPDTAIMEDLRRYQFDQHERAVGPATINGAVSALRFLFGITLKRPEMALGLVVVRSMPKLRVVLSVEETARLLEAGYQLRCKQIVDEFGIVAGDIARAEERLETLAALRGDFVEPKACLGHPGPERKLAGPSRRFEDMVMRSDPCCPRRQPGEPRRRHELLRLDLLLAPRGLGGNERLEPIESREGFDRRNCRRQATLLLEGKDLRQFERGMGFAD